MSLTQETHTVDVEIGKRVRARRQAARLSLEELGRRVGVTYQQVQKYETGGNRIAASTLLRIAVALDTTATDLLGQTGQEDLSVEAIGLARRLDRVRTECRTSAFAAVTNVIGAIEEARA